MSDRYSKLFASYTDAITYAKLPKETVHEVKRRILDSFGTAMSAMGEDTPKAVRNYAYDYALAPGQRGGTLWGTATKTPPEMAGFVNGVAVRYLDFNDTFLSKEPLHPSDMIGALMALAEWNGNTTKELITAIAVAYEIPINLCDAASLRKNKWDHVNYIAIGTACGAAKLLGLTGEQVEHAISIAIVPHASMRQTRAGELSMWKGAAAANSARNAVFGALLAAKGVSGPYQPFDGEMGFFRQLLNGEKFDEKFLKGMEKKTPPSRIMDTYIKFWPVEYHAQSAVDAALKLHKQMNGAKLKSLHIDTFKASYEIIAKDPEKWEPKTRETADHSIQYITLVALMDGKITKESFSHERIFDKTTRAMLKKNVTLAEDDKLTAGYPFGIPNRITATTDADKKLSLEVSFPRGHAQNPMTDDEVVEKLTANTEHCWTPAQRDRVVDLVFSYEKHSVADIVEAIRV
jgi:2-methylcitrate dehydratase